MFKKNDTKNDRMDNVTHMIIIRCIPTYQASSEFCDSHYRMGMLHIFFYSMMKIIYYKAISLKPSLPTDKSINPLSKQV